VFEAIVYFRSPPVEWSGKVRDEDVIARLESPWRWLALIRAHSFVAQCMPGRCDFFLMKDGELIEPRPEETLV
jgi:hypothetical protein